MTLSKRWRRVVVPFLSIIVGLGTWQIVWALDLLPRNALPSPADTFTAAVQMFANGSIWGPTLDSLLGAATGLGIAALIAIPLGLLLGSIPLFYSFMSGVLEFLRPIPPPAILPIIILLLGSGFQMKLVLVAFGCIFPMLLQCIHGARDADPVHRQTTRAFRISAPRAFFQVSIPAALPDIFTGIRVSASIALLVTLAVELIVGAPGLGSAIALAADGGQTERMTVFIMLSGLLGVAISGGLGAVQNRFITWTGKTRKETAQ